LEASQTIRQTLPRRHESGFFEALLELLFAQGRAPTHLLGDKGYSAPRTRRWLTERSITPVIPHRKTNYASIPTPLCRIGNAIANATS